MLSFAVSEGMATDRSQAGPQIAGAAGLLFEPNGNDCRGDDGDLTDYRVIVRLPDGGWCYVGQYLLVPSPSLLPEEWLIQPERVSILLSYCVLSSRILMVFPLHSLLGEEYVGERDSAKELGLYRPNSGGASQ